MQRIRGAVYGFVCAMALSGTFTFNAWSGGSGAVGLNHFLDRVDADKDGAVSRAEAEIFRQSRFSSADANRDGVLTEAEAIAHAQRRAVEMATKIFARMDANGDGRVLRSEFDTISGQRLDRVFRRFDGNGDGLITRAEMRAGRHQSLLVE